MKFSIQKEVFEQFAELSIGLVVVKNLENKGSSEELIKLIGEISSLIKANFNPTEFANNNLISPWKSAYFDYEEKPHLIHSSVERLTNEVINGEVESKNKLKDVCSLISLKHTVPIECFDIGKMNGDFSLIRAKGNEFFYSEGETKNPEKGEFIYLDSINVLARKLDYTEGDKALVDENSKEVVVLVEGLKPVLKEKVEEISAEVGDLINTFCKGEVNYLILDKENPSVEF